MLNLSNILSLSRAGFALAFLQQHTWVRLAALILAMVSDFLDGYIARRQKMTTQFGAVLDPIMDKFFVFLAGSVFYLEGKLSPLELGAFLSRDVSLCFFGLYLGITHGLKGYECKAIWWGKTTTIAQFFVLMALTINVQVPFFIYALFIAMAGFAFLELIIRYRRFLDKS